MTASAPKLPNLSRQIPGYSMVEELYLGSRTIVYRAVQIAQSRSVIIKVLRREYPSFSEVVQFRNQYTIAKNLPIAGIVQPLSLKQIDSGYALIMEDDAGISLGKYVQQQTLNLSEILTIGLQLADILQELSHYNVVHKDIKPTNILIHPESKQIKLIDFSIASLLPKETQELQSPNILEGTLAYLAPEQTGRMNRGIDYRSDFYALGVTLYQLLTGELPFTSDDPLELMHCHIARIPVPADQVNSKIPRMLAAIVDKLMAKNAEDRYQSALGLKYDLEQCLTQWKATGEIADFPLGQQDLSDRFLIPEKLYGRTTEVQMLLEAFDRVAQGHSELMLVAGFSGIGKTAVVNEVHKPIVRQRGYFIKGKFDQFNRNIPLSAFVQALQDLMRQLLSESDTELAEWKDKILTALGDNSQVIIDVVPELATILGPQPAVPELSGSEAQNRFHRLLQQFIHVFATAAHPLVFFLDDLQWADLASLGLIELLMQQHDGSYLLLIGAYRDNEVSATHPLMLTVDKLQKTKRLLIHTLTLPPLGETDINHLIADTLNCSAESALPLTQLIYQKAQGNPFFTTQLLRSLHTDRWIEFNRETRQWQCDMTQIRSLMLSQDVVEFMTLQLQKLPDSCQEVLKLAACIGNHFDLTTLATVCERSTTAIATDLWPALQEGFILPQNEIYKFFQNTAEAKNQTLEERVLLNTVSCSYRFLHDRIQQAAYSLIAEEQRQMTHLRMGQLLLNSTSISDQKERLFEIVNHLNIGCSLITISQEQEELAQLNLMAGQKAKAATAYGSAVGYLTTGISLLPETAWDSHYDLTLTLHTEVADASYLNQDFEQMEHWATLVLHHAETLLDKIPVQHTRLMGAKTQGRILDAIQLGLQVLSSLGIELPTQPTSADVHQGFIATGQLWEGRSPLTSLDLPVITDPNRLAVMKILSWLVPCAYLANPPLMVLLILKQVELSLQDGNCPVSIYSYADYSLILCSVIRDIPSGYDFGQLALQLLEQFQANSFKARSWYVTHTYTRHWKSPLQEAIPNLQAAYQSGLETGDLDSAGLSAAAYCYYAYHAGQELTNLFEEVNAYHETMCQLKQSTPQYYLEIYQQTILNLLGQSKVPGQLEGSIFSQETTLPLLVEANHRTALFYFYVNQTVLAYLFGEYQQAAQASSLTEQYLDGGIGTFMVPLYSFYDSLLQLALYKDAPEENQNSILERVNLHQTKLKEWAFFAACNHQHRWELIEAERCAIVGDRIAATELYDRAIANAHANGFIQDEALASELAAKFYLDWGREKIAQDYLTKAYYGYVWWGAKAKVQDIEDRYSTLLTHILQQQQASLSTTETVFTPELLTKPQLPDAQISTAGTVSITATLDLATILKASQTLSSEIQLDKLLEALLHTVIENAGADKGVLLMPRENQWFVEAVATIDCPVQLKSTVLSSSMDVPHALINHVKRSSQPTVVADATTHPNLLMDAYIAQQQPKSLLCTPILHQGKLVAILYLENHIASGAFTSDRIELLNVLCTQAAISLENARLYQQAQAYAQQLEQSQLQIIQSEKMASLGNLIAGIAHEINNPIGFLNGSINNVEDYVKDMFRHLTLCEQYLSHASTAIQDHAEEIDLEFLREDLPKILSSMQGATDRIKGISNSLRTFSRSDTEHKVDADLHAGLDSTLLILKYRLKANEHRPAIEVIQEYGELPPIKCFPGQLNQVFMNILANAIDVLDELPQASSSETALESNPHRITIQTLLTDSNTIEVRIHDNGKGMSEEVRARIFDHLFTTKGVGKGTGLGLTIARQIVVEKHGGSLAVQSELGKGTQFCIRLPIDAE